MIRSYPCVQHATHYRMTGARIRDSSSKNVAEYVEFRRKCLVRDTGKPDEAVTVEDASDRAALVLSPMPHDLLKAKFFIWKVDGNYERSEILWEHKRRESHV